MVGVPTTGCYRSFFWGVMTSLSRRLVFTFFHDTVSIIFCSVCLFIFSAIVFFPCFFRTPFVFIAHDVSVY